MHLSKLTGILGAGRRNAAEAAAKQRYGDYPPHRPDANWRTLVTERDTFERELQASKPAELPMDGANGFALARAKGFAAHGMYRAAAMATQIAGASVQSIGDVQRIALLNLIHSNRDDVAALLCQRWLALHPEDAESFSAAAFAASGPATFAATLAAGASGNVVRPLLHQQALGEVRCRLNRQGEIDHHGLMPPELDRPNGRTQTFTHNDYYRASLSIRETTLGQMAMVRQAIALRPALGSEIIEEVERTLNAPGAAECVGDCTRSFWYRAYHSSWSDSQIAQLRKAVFWVELGVMPRNAAALIDAGHAWLAPFIVADAACLTTPTSRGNLLHSVCSVPWAHIPADTPSPWLATFVSALGANVTNIAGQTPVSLLLRSQPRSSMETPRTAYYVAAGVADALVAGGADLRGLSSAEIATLLTTVRDEANAARIVALRGSANFPPQDNFVGMLCRFLLDSRSRSEGTWALTRIETLVRLGWNINATDGAGRTLLMLCDDPVIVERLLTLGANVNARDSQHKTPLHHLVGNTHNNGYHSLLPWAREPTSGAQCAKLLMDKGADLFATDGSGKWPLEQPFGTSIFANPELRHKDTLRLALDRGLITRSRRKRLIQSGLGAALAAARHWYDPAHYVH